MPAARQVRDDERSPLGVGQFHDDTGATEMHAGHALGAGGRPGAWRLGRAHQGEAGSVSGPPRSSRPGPALGKIGAWLNPRYDDDTRVRFVASAEAMGYPAAWLGFGSAAIGDLSLAERALDATTT